MRKALLASAVVIVIFLLSSAPAFALCATCYTAALGEKGLHALKSGILILLLPTVTIFSTLLWVTFRYRNSYRAWPVAAPVAEAPADPGLLAAYEEDIASSRL